MSDAELGKDLIFPGTLIGDKLDDIVIGDGVYEYNTSLYASKCGILAKTRTSDDKVKIEVINNKPCFPIPAVDSIVTCRITNVNSRFAKCDILGVKDDICHQSFKGIIRKEDVRRFEKDKVQLSSSFRPGDIVLAKVLTLGDSPSFLLTTAENQLGVISATSESGERMIPVSWTEMECCKTRKRERRKVAQAHTRFIAENIVNEIE